jgi:hypothetical protein
MRKFGSPLAVFAVLAASVIVASGRSDGAAIAPHALHNAMHADRLALTQRAQFIYLGRPYCWYPYGWAGAGWYWCGYGTRAGIGWGGVYGWNGWVVPRSYRALHLPPGSRFRRY